MDDLFSEYNPYPYIYVQYCPADADKVIPIVEALRREGYDVWCDDNFDTQIDTEAIRKAAALILFYSKAASKSKLLKSTVKAASSMNSIDKVCVCLDDSGFGMSFLDCKKNYTLFYVSSSDYIIDELDSYLDIYKLPDELTDSMLSHNGDIDEIYEMSEFEQLNGNENIAFEEFNDMSSESQEANFGELRDTFVDAPVKNESVNFDEIVEPPVQNDSVNFDEIIEPPVQNDSVNFDEIIEPPVQDESVNFDEVVEPPVQDDSVIFDEIVEPPVQDESVNFDEIVEPPVQDESVNFDEIAEPPVQNESVNFDEIAEPPVQDEPVVEFFDPIIPKNTQYFYRSRADKNVINEVLELFDDYECNDEDEYDEYLRQSIRSIWPEKMEEYIIDEPTEPFPTESEEERISDMVSCESENQGFEESEDAVLSEIETDLMPKSASAIEHTPSDSSNDSKESDDIFSFYKFRELPENCGYSEFENFKFIDLDKCTAHGAETALITQADENAVTEKIEPVMLDEKIKSVDGELEDISKPVEPDMLNESFELNERGDTQPEFDNIEPITLSDEFAPSETDEVRKKIEPESNPADEQEQKAEPESNPNDEQEQKAEPESNPTDEQEQKAEPESNPTDEQEQKTELERNFQDGGEEVWEKFRKIVRVRAIRGAKRFTLRRKAQGTNTIEDKPTMLSNTPDTDEVSLPQAGFTGESQFELEYPQDDTIDSIVVEYPVDEDFHDTEPDPVTEREPEPVTKTEPEPVIETEPEPVTKTEPEPVTEREPEPVTEIEPEQNPESDTETATGDAFDDSDMNSYEFFTQNVLADIDSDGDWNGESFFAETEPVTESIDEQQSYDGDNAFDNYPFEPQLEFTSISDTNYSAPHIDSNEPAHFDVESGEAKESDNEEAFAVETEPQEDEQELDIKIQILMKAAEQGNADAQYKLGLSYERGDRVEQNYVKAAHWYILASNRDNANAQFNLAQMYEKGLGVTKNITEAVNLYRAAAKQGHSNAQTHYGICLRNGMGIEKNESKAVKWFVKASEKGNAAAIYNLGVCFELGRGVEQDLSRALQLYLAAANQDYADAQNALANCYISGNGIPANYTEAVRWYSKAARNGNVAAQFNIGFCCENGIGIEKNDDMAYRFYKIAAENGSENALKRLTDLGFIKSDSEI